MDDLKIIELVLQAGEHHIQLRVGELEADQFLRLFRYITRDATCVGLAPDSNER